MIVKLTYRDFDMVIAATGQLRPEQRRSAYICDVLTGGVITAPRKITKVASSANIIQTAKR